MDDYQEKLRLAKEALDSGSYDKETIEYIFPELKESEDERLRESLIGFLKTIASLKDGKTISNEDFDSVALLEWANWLEKQSGQTHTWSEIDAFIEKACNWMRENITNNPECNKIISKNGAITMGLLIEDFKNYMKGE